MFEKIARFAETLATSAGQSRRGFLGRLGKAALGVAGVVGGLLLFQGEALSTKSTCTGACTYSCPNGDQVQKGCSNVCNCDQSVNHHGMTCLLIRSTCRHIW